VSSGRRVLLFLALLAVIFFVLRPRQSFENLRQMYVYRRWLLVVISTLLLVYIVYGLYQIWLVGFWWLD
jgi:hypothetical protein